MAIVQVASDGREVLEKMINSPLIQAFKVIVAVGPDVDLSNPTLLLWGIFTRFDCARDTFFARTEIIKGYPHYHGPLFIDATWKNGYPEPLTMTDDIVKLVDRRWLDYGFKKST